MKTCRKCLTDKPLEAFYQDRSRPDGHRNSCIECDKARKRTPEVREQSRRYNNGEKGKIAQKRHRDSGKKEARQKVYRASPERAPLQKAYNRQYQRQYYYTPQKQEWYKQYLSNPEYREALKEYQRRWKQTPKGKAHMQRWCQRRQERYKSDPAYRAAMQKWRHGWNRSEKGKDHSRRGHQRREALKLSLQADLTQSEWESCLDYFEHRCAYCGSDGPLQQDHFVPLSKGGPYTRSNIVPACGPCNRKKNGRMPFKWCPPETLTHVLSYFQSLTDA